ncbi:MAG: 4Fe-4S single cluster domain of Ferredoxin [Chloroflexota bacterium]|jgi:ferredoxin|nr:4Fe-4S single cluster domain of Ferredoxin [Chloroflexota bacterium]
MPAHVTVDPELCIGSGECVRLLPSAFRIDESRGVSVPLAGAATAAWASLARARGGCPTRAIEVTDANGDPIPGDAGGR